MIKIIKLLIKRKTFCFFCKYRIKYIKQFDGYIRSTDRPADDGKNICGKTLLLYTNEVGEERLKEYGTVQVCEACGLIAHDDRVIRYQKCSEKNRNYKCKDFNAKVIYKLFFIGERYGKDRKNSRRKPGGNKTKR
jgi:hypothetical protein